MKKFLKSKTGRALVIITIIGIVAYIVYYFYGKMMKKGLAGNGVLSTGELPSGDWQSYAVDIPVGWIGCHEAPDYGLSLAELNNTKEGYGGIKINVNFAQMGTTPIVGDYVYFQANEPNANLDGYWKILSIGAAGGGYDNNYVVTDMPYVCSDHPNQAAYRPADGKVTFFRQD
jgi:hypothetical protein